MILITRNALVLLAAFPLGVFLPVNVQQFE